MKPAHPLPPVPRVSVLVTMGESSTPDPTALIATARTIAQRRDCELVVVDDCGPEPVRTALAALTGNLRVLHQNPPVGAAAALATGVSVATGEFLVLCAPDLAVPGALLDEVVEGFESDPGIGLLEPSVTYHALAPDGPRPPVPPLLVLRRLALDALGGTNAVAARASTASPTGASPNLVPGALLEALACSGWRRGALKTALEHSDGTVPTWSRTPKLLPFEGIAWRPPYRVASPERGINVVGLLEAACGIGDAARRHVEALATTPIPHSTFAYHFHQSPQHPFTHRDGTTLRYDTTLLALNPDQLPALSVHAGTELWADGRYTIGLWFWEVEELSVAIRSGFRYVNEVWAASEFNRAAYARGTDKAVVTIPLPVAYRQGSPRRTRHTLGLPDAFTFLTIFDFGSVAERKNSLGVVTAFCEAFAPGEGPVLVLKTLNADWDHAGWQQLHAALRGRRDVVVLDGLVSDETISEMVGTADCYVSLHRAEGFGLTPAEAMAWGRPVVATGYSGNLDFMTEANSYLVSYDLTPVPDHLARIYPRGSTWAEPRLAEASALLRRVYTDRADAAARGAKAQQDIRRSHALEVTASAISERLGVIWDQRASSRRPTRPQRVPPRPAHRMAPRNPEVPKPRGGR